MLMKPVRQRYSPLLPQKQLTVSKSTIRKTLNSGYYEIVEKKCGRVQKNPLYPNLMKSSFEDDTENTTHSLSSSRTTNLEENGHCKCYTCGATVGLKNMADHLFFKSTLCLDCGWVAERCSKFANVMKTTSRTNGLCQHMNLAFLEYTKKGFKKLIMDKHSHHSDKCSSCLISKYFDSLEPLRHMKPWDSVLGDRKGFGDCCCPPPKSSSSTSTEEDTFRLPDDPRYLILTQIVEECPDCYNQIDPLRIKFNLHNWLIKYSCYSCQLPMFFVLKPTDGSSHRMTIL